MERGSKTAKAIQEAVEFAYLLGRNDVAERLEGILRQLTPPTHQETP